MERIVKSIEDRYLLPALELVEEIRAITAAAAFCQAINLE